MAHPFVLFGWTHLAVLTLTLTVPSALAFWVRRARNKRLAIIVRWAFLLFLFFAWILWLAVIVQRGWFSLGTVIPMQLCDWAVIATAIALQSLGQRSFELAYFWGMSGSLLALITPALTIGFPDAAFIVFFAFHGGVVGAVLYLILGQGLRPYRRSVVRVAVWSMVYLAAALALNAALGTNFGFLQAKPETPSLLDYLGPWPLYVVAMVGIGVGAVLALYAPFFALDCVKRRSDDA